MRNERDREWPTLETAETAFDIEARIPPLPPPPPFPPSSPLFAVARRDDFDDEGISLPRPNPLMQSRPPSPDPTQSAILLVLCTICALQVIQLVLSVAFRR